MPEQALRDAHKLAQLGGKKTTHVHIPTGSKRTKNLGAQAIV